MNNCRLFLYIWMHTDNLRWRLPWMGVIISCYLSDVFRSLWIKSWEQSGSMSVDSALCTHLKQLGYNAKGCQVGSRNGASHKKRPFWQFVTIMVQCQQVLVINLNECDRFNWLLPLNFAQQETTFNYSNVHRVHKSTSKPPLELAAARQNGNNRAN